LHRERWLGLGHLCGEWASTRKAAHETAVTYLEYIWGKYSAEFSPLATRVPTLRLGFRGIGGGAHSNALLHEIYCNLCVLTRPTLVHEAGHLLTWRDSGHGPDFCAALIHMWEREFGIAREHALAVAARLGVAVADSEAGDERPANNSAEAPHTRHVP
jgi:hypothetical protein